MPLPHGIKLTHRVQRSEHVMFQELDGEVVLLDLASEKYFGLNEVGSRIWALLSEARSMGAIHAVLCEEFDAPADAIERDLLGLVEKLAAAGLVKATE